MAKKIIWTQTAIEDRFRIYRFWLYKTKSKTYSEKLEKLFKDSANLISKFPELGTLSDFNGIRAKSF
jgi:plasmid stabilization system protein ParE